MKPVVTLYLVASEDNYRLVHTHDEGLAEIGHSKTGLHHGGAAHVAGHRPKDGAERASMARQAAKALDEEWARGGYERIVVVAGPKMLGEIRHDLPKALQAHVVAELHKDLVHTPLPELLAHFKGAVPTV